MDAAAGLEIYSSVYAPYGLYKSFEFRVVFAARFGLHTARRIDGERAAREAAEAIERANRATLTRGNPALTTD